MLDMGNTAVNKVTSLHPQQLNIVVFGVGLERHTELYPHSISALQNLWAFLHLMRQSYPQRVSDVFQIPTNTKENLLKA